MADPVSLTALSMGASALGGVTSAIGNVMGGNSQSSSYKYQAGVARVNKQIAEQNADYARTVGERESQRVGMKTRFERSNALVKQSGSGIDVTSGSPAAVRDSITELGAHDQSVVRSNAARRAYGFEVEAAQQEAAANMYGKAAQRSKQAGYISAASSILGSAASVSGKWMQASQLGVFGGSGYQPVAASSTSYYKD